MVCGQINTHVSGLILVQPHLVDSPFVAHNKLTDTRLLGREKGTTGLQRTS